MLSAKIDEKSTKKNILGITLKKRLHLKKFHNKLNFDEKAYKRCSTSFQIEQPSFVQFSTKLKK